jgi:histone acetyltransferase
MQTKLEAGSYTDINTFVTDVRLIPTNCLLYNPHDSVYAKAAMKLQKYFEGTLLKELLAKD